MARSVFYDLYPAEEAHAMEIKAQFLMELEDWLKASGLTQAQAAKRLGVDQPRVSDIKNGKIGRFTIDKLIEMSMRVGLVAEVTFKKQLPEAA